MDRIWKFFENMNEYMYVVDMDTNELLYMNRKTLDTYGFSSLEEIVGKKCYEVLQGCTAPCAACNNKELTEGQFKEWKGYSPMMGKYLLYKDTMMTDEQGRRCRIELAVEHGITEKQEEMIQSYQNMEGMANEGIRLALQKPEPDSSIDVLLEYLGKALQGERTYIFEKNESGGDDNTYEWVALGVTPEKENLQNLPPEVCANWYRNFQMNRNITIHELEDIREKDPLQYENLKRQDIHSLVVVPLYDEKDVIGFYGVDNPPKGKLDYAENMLQIMAHFIVSCIKRRELMKELKQMSFSDRLTQFGNRFAMDEFVSQLREGDDIGVVYCDITGLKQVNDTRGHSAGDQFILEACGSLKRVFGEYGLFRIGGDEILALCSPITEEEVNRKIHALKEDMQEHSVTMAVGAVWKQIENNADLEFDHLLTEAEKLMYEDKDAYYKAAGIERRK